jgi:pimeloyl-ACP methyl ester carboxylesterase
MSMNKDFRYSIRFYRNGAIAILVLVACFASILAVRYSFLHLLWVAPLCTLGLMLLQGHRLTHPRLLFPRRPTPPADAALPYEQVHFPSRDGLPLSAWYLPGRNRAAVILAHPFSLQGAAMAKHAAPLAGAGYAVLLLDLRAHGHSAGDTCTLGWLETYDVLGAVDYLQGHADVDGDRIGVLGVSLGAQAALRAAALSAAIGGVVADGPGPGGASDRGRPPATPWGWLRYGLARLNDGLLPFLNGVYPSPGLLEVAGDVAPRPILLIASGEDREKTWVRALHRAASEPKELWELPEAGHAAGMLVYPNLYARRIVDFFNSALLGGSPTHL